MFFSVFFGVLAVLYILNRQRRVRLVPRLLGLRFPIVLGVVGLIDLLSYTDNHHPSHSAYLWVLATLIVGGVILGAVRALTVKIWTSNNWVVRQGTGPLRFTSSAAPTRRATERGTSRRRASCCISPLPMAYSAT